MIGFDVMTLIGKSYEETDTLGQKIPKDNPRDVFCRVESISQSEYFEASRNGLHPQYKVILTTSLDYDGEDTAEYNGKRYAVYRSFRVPTDQLELYLQPEVGT